MYKIKIACTSEDDLCYNNKKISKKNYNKINFEDLMNKTDYIETALILYKNFENFTTKSLEFMCKREISELEFKEFIVSMKKIGFESKNKNTIKLIKINKNKLNELILTYNFQLETKEPNKEYIFKKNKSSYSTQFLYKNIR